MNIQHARIMKIVTAVGVVASVAVFLAPAAATLVEQLSGRLANLGWTSLGMAFGLTLIFWPLQACVWNLVLQALGHSLPAGTAVRIWLTTQTCRWLPGGVWHYGSRTLHAISHGIPSPVAVASLALELLLTVLAWGGIGLVGMIWYGNRQIGWEQLFSERTLEVTLAVSVGALLLGVVAWLSRRLYPRKVQALRDRFASLRAVRPRPIPTATCFVVYVALAMFNGMAFYCVLNAVSPHHNVPFWAAVSVNALAWTVGLFAIMAPSGLVVREATLALQLGLWLPPAEAVLIAVLWRLVQLIVEPICVAVAYAPQAISARFWPRAKPNAPWAALSTLETKSSK